MSIIYSPVFTVYCIFLGLRGTDIIAHTQLSITQKGKDFIWKGYGLWLIIPKNSLPEGTVDSLLDIKVSLSGLFEFPTNSEQVSAVYWIYCAHHFVKSLTLEIQHCAAITNASQCSQFAIVTTSCSQKTLPYTFKELVGGIFEPHHSYGSISVTHFSGFTSIQKKQHVSGTPTSLTGESEVMPLSPDNTFSAPIQYCAKLYRIREDSFWKLHFVVTKDLEACSSVSCCQCNSLVSAYSCLCLVPLHTFSNGAQDLLIPEAGW